MIELYGFGRSRWIKCYWLLQELGLEFRAVNINPMLGEARTTEMLRLNPFGKLPILIDGELVIYEATAILNYLAEKNSYGDLIPKSKTSERALYDQWMSICITELEQPLWQIFKIESRGSQQSDTSGAKQLAQKDFEKVARVIDTHIDTRPTFIFDRFTALDISMAYTLKWALRIGLLNELKNCIRYVEEITSRPNFPSQLY